MKPNRFGWRASAQAGVDRAACALARRELTAEPCSICFDELLSDLPVNPLAPPAVRPAGQPTASAPELESAKRRNEKIIRNNKRAAAELDQRLGPSSWSAGDSEIFIGLHSEFAPQADVAAAVTYITERDVDFSHSPSSSLSDATSRCA